MHDSFSPMDTESKWKITTTKLKQQHIKSKDVYMKNTRSSQTLKERSAQLLPQQKHEEVPFLRKHPPAHHTCTNIGRSKLHMHDSFPPMDTESKWKITTTKLKQQQQQQQATRARQNQPSNQPSNQPTNQPTNQPIKDTQC